MNIVLRVKCKIKISLENIKFVFLKSLYNLKKNEGLLFFQTQSKIPLTSM